MYLTHIVIPMPKGGQALARTFYGEILELREVAQPELLTTRDTLCFDLGGLELQLLPEERHFGLGCGDLNGLKTRVGVGGVTIERVLSGPQKGLIVRDPFGHLIEIREPGSLRAARWVQPR